MTTIDITLDPPNPLTDSQATYNSKALAFTQALNPWAAKVNTVAGEINADKLAAGNSATAAADSATAAADEKTLAQGFAEDAAEQAALAAAAAGSAVNAPGTSATSTTPRTVGTGTLTLTIQPGKAYAVGQFVVVASSISPENYMIGQILAHDSGTGAITVNVTQVGGDGSFSDWTVSVAGAPADLAVSKVVVVSALDINCSSGTYFTKTISANSTFTFSSVPTGAYAFTLELTHTSGTVTWPTSVTWSNGSAPSLTTGKAHLFTFVTDDGGARWRAIASTNYVI